MNSSKALEHPQRESVLLKALKSYQNISIISILLGMCVIMTFASSNFLQAENLFSVARAFSYIAIMAIGECMVIITAGIDLSIGSVFGLAGVVSTIALTKWGFGVGSAILAGIVVGALAGSINGILITKIKLPPFIATLGTLSIARGVCFVITRGYPVIGLSEEFLVLGQGYLGVIPIPVIIMLILVIFFSVMLNKTVLGRRIYALGGNEEATRISGVNVEKIKLIVYIMAGALAGFAGIISASRLGVGQAVAGDGYEMDAVAAVIIGGASLSGGRGTMSGVLIGAAIMGVLNNALVLLNVSAYWQEIVIGCVIIIAVTGDQFRKSSI